MLYTALLPVRKRDVVRARYIFAVCVQLAGVLLCGLLTLLRMTALGEASVYGTNPLMNANPAFLGYLLAMMAQSYERYAAGHERTGGVKAPWGRFPMALAVHYFFSFFLPPTRKKLHSSAITYNTMVTYSTVW